MFVAVVGTDPRATLAGSQQLALVVAPTVVRHRRRQRGALTGEPLHRLQRPDGTLHTGRADLEEVRPRDGLIHIETIRQSSAETRAIRHPDAPRPVEEDADGPAAPLDHELDIDELEAILRGEGIRQLANLFSDFQIGLPDETKNGVVAPAPLLTRRVQEGGPSGKPAVLPRGRGGEGARRVRGTRSGRRAGPGPSKPI